MRVSNIAIIEAHNKFDQIIYCLLSPKWRGKTRQFATSLAIAKDALLSVRTHLILWSSTQVCRATLAICGQSSSDLLHAQNRTTGNDRIR